MYAYLFTIVLSAHQPLQNINYVAKHHTEALVAVAGTNMVFGCLKAGIGRVMYDGNFFEGCGRGLVAGAVAFSGKYLASYNDRYNGFGALGRVTHALGASMADNAGRNEPMFSSYTIDIGPTTLTFSDGLIPKVQLSIYSLAGTVHSLVSGHKFDLESSLYDLTPTWVMPKITPNKPGTMIAYSVGNNIMYSANYKSARPHELAHVLQFSDHRFWGSLLFKNQGVEQYFTASRDLAFIALTAGMGNTTPTLYDFSPLELEAYSLTGGIE